MGSRSVVAALLLALVSVFPETAAAQSRLFVQVQPFGQLPSVSAIDLSSGRVEWQVAVPYARRLAITADGRYLLAATTRQSLTEPPESDLWVEDLRSGNVVRFALGSIEVADLITHPRRLEAYVRSVSGVVRVTPSGTQGLPACDRPGGLSLSVNGEYLAASCGPDRAREVVVFETTTWTVSHRFPTVTGYLDRLMLNADGSRVFVLEDGVAAYDVASGSRVLHGLDPPVPTGFWISSLDSGSPARETLFVGAYQSFSLPDPAAAEAPGVTFERNLYYLVDAATLRITQTLPPAAKAFKTEVAPDGRHALVASRGIYSAVIVQLIDLAANVEIARRVWSPGYGLDIALAAAPLAPVAIVASVSPERAVTLRWDLPDWSPAPTHFVLEAGSAPGLADVATMSLDGDLRSTTVPGVPPGVYHVRLRSVNHTGACGPSNEVTVTVR